MAYQLKEVTIRTSNSSEGMKAIEDIWCDITNGKLPLLFDSEHHFQQGISPISKYSNYASDETGEYDFSIIGVTADFFTQMDQKVEKGIYKKYDKSDEDNLKIATKKAWEAVWQDQKNGIIKRQFSEDYESSVPAEFTKDGKSHCYLYIAIHQ